jgi:hypothetical protein
MYTSKNLAHHNRVLVTALATLGWLTWMLGWLAFAWSHYSFLQNLASLGISTFVFAAIAGLIWVGDQGLRLVATILATLGWFSFLLYWIAFAWSRHALLQNGAVLIASFLVWLGTVVVFLLAGPTGEYC